jgi:hypothetical protein
LDVEVIVAAKTGVGLTEGAAVADAPVFAADFFNPAGAVVSTGARCCLVTADLCFRSTHTTLATEAAVFARDGLLHAAVGRTKSDRRIVEAFFRPGDAVVAVQGDIVAPQGASILPPARAVGGAGAQNPRRKAPGNSGLADRTGAIATSPIIRGITSIANGSAVRSGVRIYWRGVTLGTTVIGRRIQPVVVKRGQRRTGRATTKNYAQNPKFAAIHLPPPWASPLGAVIHITLD